MGDLNIHVHINNYNVHVYIKICEKSLDYSPGFFQLITILVILTGYVSPSEECLKVAV